MAIGLPGAAPRLSEDGCQVQKCWGFLQFFREMMKTTKGLTLSLADTYKQTFEVIGYLETNFLLSTGARHPLENF